MTLPDSEQDRPQTHYQKHHPHEGSKAAPYWKRAHRDWKVWLAVIVMLAAMWVYVRSNNLSLRPAGPVQQPVPAR